MRWNLVLSLVVILGVACCVKGAEILGHWGGVMVYH